eukprot:CAMPEP_0172538524 /NCGR_PEP_ID=MMETSP1067-20121228/9897_1 /TAXON_ID=265564 ORGANISM="Thalassiosira punctigera, Strain Tpunct2005C2" /NCGR_SAMPLE_ID=MMETSP1067 /ASSEMBLY_ACC=CAM_ASM_000444 /LENGTH=180 /DNA_ID=CAMNT_0013324033 /DNA_START=15 /DNA_END=554 /DNA_ORIENTATION=+
MHFWCTAGVDNNYEALLKRLERKQREFATGVEDKSSMNPIQRRIVETQWTYPGHEDDVEEAKKSFHVRLFNQDLEKCHLRQMIHDKDFRSHRALIKLDEVTQALSYPGCKDDVKRAEAYLSREGYTLHKAYFHEMIQGMRNKQNVYDGVVMEFSMNTSDGVAKKDLVQTLDDVVSGFPTK